VNLRQVPLSIARPGAAVHIRCSERIDGNFHLEQSAEALDATRRKFVDLPWTQLDEVHGSTVLVVDRPGAFDGVIGDALVTELDDAVLGVWVGDCAPVALVGDTGAVGAVHAGWKGIERGVLQTTVATMRRALYPPVLLRVRCGRPRASRCQARRRGGGLHPSGHPCPRRRSGRSCCTRRGGCGPRRPIGVHRM
jgi:copper oxidase (laccase) domain-containing protein